jgi:hypothetical protein
VASRKRVASRNYKYMHTLDSRPAHYNGEQIVLATRHVRLIDSLTTVSEQRRASMAFRKERGYFDSPRCYGHIRVLI